MHSTKPNSWLPLFATNFLGAFNDNFIKFMAIYIGVPWVGIENRDLVISIATVALVLPYILFSPLAGRFSLIYPKSKIMVWLKFAEIPIVLIAMLGFFIKSLPIVIFATVLMGLQSAIYSPSKYGLIRDTRGDEGISFGTGTMEMLTFTGVLAGTMLAGFLSDIYGFILISVVMLAIAITGYFTALRIRANEPPLAEKDDVSKIGYLKYFWLKFIIGPINPFLFIYKQVKIAANYKRINLAIISLAAFWFMAAIMQSNITSYSPKVLNASNTMTSLITAFAAIGIAAGSVVSGLLSGKKVVTSISVVGGLGLSISMLMISILPAHIVTLSVLVFSGSFFAGFYKIPLSAYVQESVKGRKLGDILAYQNLLDFIFILVSAAVFYVATKYFENNVTLVFNIVGLVAALMATIIFFNIPGAKSLFKTHFKKTN